MEKFFNNAGPSVAEDHYIIDPLKRIDVDNIEFLIAQKRYFILHAPRQTGKTTSLLALMHYLNQQGKYHALYANIEAAQALRHDVGKSMNTIFNRRPNVAWDDKIWQHDETYQKRQLGVWGL